MFWNRSQHVVLVATERGNRNGAHPAFLRQPTLELVDAHDRKQALRIARDRRPALVIDNLDPKGVGASAGTELCVSLKSDPQTRSIPVIVIADSATEPEATPEAGGASDPVPHLPDVILSRPIVQRQYFEAVSRFVPLPKRRDLRQTVNLRFLFDDGVAEHQAFSRDLSLYGAFLKTEHDPPHGAHLKLRFHLPGLAAELTCSAIVRRSGPSDPHEPSGFAIEFEGMADDDQERLQQFIGRNLRRSSFRL